MPGRQLQAGEILLQGASSACTVGKEAVRPGIVAYSILEARMEGMLEENSFVETGIAALSGAVHMVMPNTVGLLVIVGAC